MGDLGGSRIHLDAQGGISGVQHFDAAVHDRARPQVVDDVVPCSRLVGQVGRDVDEAHADASWAGVAAVAREAHSSLGLGNVHAAVLMARTTVEAPAKTKGIVTGNLVAKIDALYAQHLIYEHVRDAAHEVRFAGNDAAHGDLVDDPISAEEAEAIMLLEGVFIAPAKTAAQAAARQARKNATVNGSGAVLSSP
ncbi:DUF4145 domain-containing protein [Streptomyces sp900116325]|uniref:DUF4145 domain-containing protein n=1 Tax=Streptomyces sp. 900116325 TaxID=3154295 RepID=UPI0033BA8E12